MLLRLLKSLWPGAAAKTYRYRGRVQEPADVAVAVQSVLRPSVVKAVESVFEQRFEGNVHVLLGVDRTLGDPGVVRRLVRACPPNMAITVFNPGYSTSARHGSLYSNHFGGAVRTILSLMANSRHVAYLDDDDWFGPEHLASLKQAIQGKAWAFSKRWFVNPFNLDPMCVDEVENLGPDAGAYAQFGGFACPSSLMVDKIECHHALQVWCLAGTPRGDGEDRMFFNALRTGFPRYGATGQATAYTVIKPDDGAHPLRLRCARSAGYDVSKLDRGEKHGFERD